jgi:hypothetical protein
VRALRAACARGPCAPLPPPSVRLAPDAEGNRFGRGGCGGGRCSGGSERRIDHFRRLDDGEWHLSTLGRDGASIELPALGGSITLEDAYANALFDEGR